MLMDERKLWSILDKKPFELRSALEQIDGDRVLQMLDYQSYLDYFNMLLPSNKEAILARLETERIRKGSSVN